MPFKACGKEVLIRYLLMQVLDSATGKSSLISHDITIRQIADGFFMHRKNNK